MRFIDRLLARQGYSEYMYSGAYPVTVADAAGRGRESADAGMVRHVREVYKASGIVFACIAARIYLLSQARFKFQNMIDKHMFVNPDLAPELGLLEQPFPNATTAELWARLETSDSTAGNDYWRRARIPGGRDQLAQMRPDTVTIVSEEVPDDMGRPVKRPVGYLEDLSQRYGAARPPEVYSVAEVAHFCPLPDPDRDFRGMSWLTPVLREVRADQALTAYKTVHVQRGANPGLTVKYQRKLSQPVINVLKKRFDALFAGPDNAGRTLILDEGADVQVTGSTLEQLQLVAVQGAGAERIAAAAMVPLEVLGLKQGDYHAAIRRMADLWARATWQSACASFEHLLDGVTPPTRLWYDVSDIAALREGELERSQGTLVRAQAVGAFVAAGYTRESAVAAADSGDIGQLKADPNAPTPGGGGSGQRPPQGGVPEALPGVVQPNLPDAKPWNPPPLPGMPNGARGPEPQAGRGLPFGDPAARAGRWDPMSHPRDAHGRFVRKEVLTSQRRMPPQGHSLQYAKVRELQPGDFIQGYEIERVEHGYRRGTTRLVFKGGARVMFRDVRAPLGVYRHSITSSGAEVTALAKTHGDRLHIAEDGGGWRSDAVQQHLRNLGQVPASHQRFLARSHAEIYVGTKPVTKQDTLGYLSHEHPPGYPAGDSYDQCAALFSWPEYTRRAPQWSKNPAMTSPGKIVLGDQVGSGSVNTAAHETGHAMDVFLGEDVFFRGAGTLSVTPEFDQIYRKFENRAKGGTWIANPYYLQEGSRGRMEFFAETYAAWVTTRGRPSPHRREEIMDALGVYVRRGVTGTVLGTEAQRYRKRETAVKREIGADLIRFFDGLDARIKTARQRTPPPRPAKIRTRV